MKIQLFQSRYKPYAEDIKEIPIDIDLKSGQTYKFTVRHKCPVEGEQDRPFGKWKNKHCCCCEK